MLCQTPAAPAAGDSSVGPGDLPVEAWVHVGGDGTVTAVAGQVEASPQVREAYHRIVAEELSLPPHRIQVHFSSPRELVGGRVPAFESVQPKFREAASRARQALQSRAAERWHLSPGQVSLRDGKVFGPGGRVLTFEELLRPAPLIDPLDLPVETRPEAEAITGEPRSKSPPEVAETATGDDLLKVWWLPPLPLGLPWSRVPPPEFADPSREDPEICPTGPCLALIGRPSTLTPGFLEDRLLGWLEALRSRPDWMDRLLGDSPLERVTFIDRTRAPRVHEETLFTLRPGSPEPSPGPSSGACRVDLPRALELARKVSRDRDLPVEVNRVDLASGGGRSPGPALVVMQASCESPEGLPRLRGLTLTATGLTFHLDEDETPEVPAVIHARESLLDALGQASGLDPLSFRRKLLDPPDATWSRILDVIGRQTRGESTARRLPGPRGKGLALHRAPRGARAATVARVQVSPGGGGLFVDRLLVVVDAGRITRPAATRKQVRDEVREALETALGPARPARSEASLVDQVEVEVILVNRLPAASLPLESVAAHTVAPAVASAIHDATGERMSILPFLDRAPEAVPAR